MLKFILLSILFSQISAQDAISYIDFGGKIPTNDQFDVRFNYNSNGNRECEVTLSNPSENGKIYAKSPRKQCGSGYNSVKAITLKPASQLPVLKRLLVEVRLYDAGQQTSYAGVYADVLVGKQGFHIWNGQVYDANEKKFIMRGINSANAYWDSYDRYLAINSFQNIAATKANTVRIVWTMGYNQALDIISLENVIKRAIQYKMVPMVELHDGTGSDDTNVLLNLAKWWANNVWLLVKYRQYIIVNIANEWSSNNLSNKLDQWKNAYVSAIKIIRDAGFSGLLVIDAPAYAQNPNGPILYGQELLNSDSSYNLIFGVHMYMEWANGKYNIVNDMQRMKNSKVPYVIGEFADEHPGGSYENCKIYYIDYLKIMSECQKHEFGYIGWSWKGNGNDECGRQLNLDVSKVWQSNTDYSKWGDRLINTPVVGIKASSVIATIF